MRVTPSSLKNILSALIIIVGIVFLTIMISNATVENFSKTYIFSDTKKIPHKKVGIVLGTSRYLSDGSKNMYFHNRIKAAVKLYYADKVDFIIVSGDNSVQEYNEPREMKRELIKLGVPSNKIFQDYAGFRTLDAVIRAKEIFGQEEFTVISQEFHNKRAIYIARKKGIDAIGYNAADVEDYSGFRTKVREVFARVKVFIDLWTSKKPKFLGEKIAVESRTLKERLDSLKKNFLEKASKEKIETYEAGIERIARSGVLESALKVGDQAPDFNLPDAAGGKTNLKSLLKKGPVVLIWYRGSWCPYSKAQLSAFKQALIEIKHLGATLVAVSPQIPDSSLAFYEKLNPGFHILSDIGNNAAGSYGIVYTLPKNIKNYYDKSGPDLRAYNGVRNAQLPLAATYVIDKAGMISYAHITADYRERAEPDNVINVLKQLRND